MSGSTTKIHEAALRKKNDSLTIWPNDVIDLRLDLIPFEFFKPSNIDFIVKVANVTDDCLILHLVHHCTGDDVFVTRRGYENVSLISSIVHRNDSVAFHGCLQRTDWVDFGNPDLR